MAGQVRTFKVYKKNVEELLAIVDLTEGEQAGKTDRAFCKALGIGYEEANVSDMAVRFAKIAARLAPKPEEKAKTK